MFSGAGFSEASFSEYLWVPIDNSAFQAFLDEVTSRRVWLLEVDAFSLASSGALIGSFSGAGFSELGFSASSAAAVGGVTTLRYASQGFISKGTDSPAYTAYEPRLQADTIHVDRSVAGKDGVGGLTTIFAELRLVNADGGFDLVPLNYSLAGRRARILVGRDTDALSAFGLVFTGVVAKTPEVALDTVTISLSDGAAKLDVPIQPTVYGGTGGLDGGADLAGKPKPKCYGHAFNVSPPLVDSANLIYQVNDGAISSAPNGYDRGIALALVAGAPAGGQYQVTAAQGTFKLGAAAAGTVTADVLGDASLSGYVNTTSDIVLRILVAQAGLTSSEIDPSSFVNLTTDAGQEVGIFIGAENRSVAEVIDELLYGVGAFGGFARTGAFTVGLFKAPAGAPAASYTEADILDIRRLPRPAPMEPTVFRATVNWQKNYTVQSDLAAAVPAARVSFAAQDARTSKAEDTSIRSRELLAKEYGPIPSLFAVQADGDAEATRLFNLWSAARGLFEVDLPLKALTRDIGQMVNITHRRLGFSAGKDARVTGHKLQGSKVTLTVLA